MQHTRKYALGYTSMLLLFAGPMGAMGGNEGVGERRKTAGGARNAVTRESGGIPDIGRARVGGSECKTGGTAGDDDWFLWQVSGRIVVSGVGADEVRLTGREIDVGRDNENDAKGERKRTKKKGTKVETYRRLFLLFKASPLPIDLEQIALD